MDSLPCNSGQHPIQIWLPRNALHISIFSPCTTKPRTIIFCDWQKSRCSKKKATGKKQFGGANPKSAFSYGFIVGGHGFHALWTHFTAGIYLNDSVIYGYYRTLLRGIRWLRNCSGDRLGTTPEESHHLPLFLLILIMSKMPWMKTWEILLQNEMSIGFRLAIFAKLSRRGIRHRSSIDGLVAQRWITYLPGSNPCHALAAVLSEIDDGGMATIRSLECALCRALTRGLA